MIRERVTVDFDTQAYYLDGKYWESWNNYGEEMADAINELLNDLDKAYQGLKKENKILYDENIQLRRKLLAFYELKDTVKYLEDKGVF